MANGSLLGVLEAVLGHAEAVRAPPFHEKMHVPVCTLLLSFVPPPPGRKLHSPRTGQSFSSCRPLLHTARKNVQQGAVFLRVPKRELGKGSSATDCVWLQEVEMFV